MTKKMTKKAMLGILAALAMTVAPLTMLTASAAAPGQEDFKYEKIGETQREINGQLQTVDSYRLTCYCGNPDVARIEIPVEINGGVVTEIGSWFLWEDAESFGWESASRRTLKEIIIPEGVTTIEANAFDLYCANDTVSYTVTIPSSVTYIGKDIFTNYEEFPKYLLALEDAALKYKDAHKNDTGDAKKLYDSIDWDSVEKYPYFLCYKDGTKVNPDSIGLEVSFEHPCRIKGSTGTAAERYAKENKIPFDFGGEYQDPNFSNKYTSYKLDKPNASTFSSGQLALVGICGLAVGIVGTTIVLLPKLKKKDGAGE